MSRAFFTLLLLLALSFSIFAGGVEWKNITPEELAQQKPTVEADADAEALFWEVRLDDKRGGRLSYNHYVRVKIFTERGREKFSKFDITFTKGKKIEDVAARVIKPDGSIVELNPNDVFERELVRAGKIRVQAKSFAIPAIQTGVIVEYQYKETYKGDSLDNERLVLQRDIPIQRLTYFIRPYEKLRVTFTFYNTEGFNFNEDADKFYRGDTYNVPAFKEEPEMPPDNEARPWVLLKYGFSSFSWNNFAYGVGGYFEEAIKPSKEIKQKADELTAGATSDDEKLRRIYEFVQKQIKNISYDRSLTDEQRDNFNIKNANDALKKGIATSGDIDILFASLAKAAGFYTGLVLSANRSQYFFEPDKYQFLSAVHPCCIAVNTNNNWRYFNPGSPFLEFGRIIWYEETKGMIVSGGNFVWKTIPYSTPENSTASRTGKFKLLDDGTLEGTVKVEYNGQRAIVRRQEHYFDTPAKREDEIKDEIKERLKTAEVSEVSIENFDDNSKPLTYHYKIKVPNYAQKTGKRIFVQPGFFEYNQPPEFSSEKRVHPVNFQYSWKNLDDIEIALPAGYDIESAESPEPISDNRNIMAQKIVIKLSDDKTSLKYNRDFHIGANGFLLFQTNVYKGLKTLFDNFQKADAQTVTLRQK